jgi:4-hydroxy-3-methylbut-2-enyl diphosphate reductase
LQIKFAKNYGFCFGVKRAISLAEENRDSTTLGPLIHNPKEISRLKDNFNVSTAEDIDEIKKGDSVIIRTHGIAKENLDILKAKTDKIIDATCPFVTKPQQICEAMSKEGYQIVIFGDVNHPEVEGVKSYANNCIVALNIDELEKKKLRDKIALISQTTRKIDEFLKIANYLVLNRKEVRIFNTICNATFDNQDSAKELSSQVDIMIVIGGKNSSNTKQLLNICKTNCIDSYLVECSEDLEPIWFEGKKLCGVTAGASTPDWIIGEIVAKVKTY